MTKKFYKLSMLFLSSAFISPSFAIQDANDLSDLSLDDLLNLEISVATKNNISQHDAPGIVTSFTEQEIKNLGYYTLKELAAITPGFSSANIYAGQTNFMVRGQKVEGFDNNKVLVLLDGIPVNHLRNGRAPLDNDMSLIGIHRVEFLKGPASSLYGTGAFFGVINLVSKKSSLKKGEFQTYIGNYQSKGVRGFATNDTNFIKTKFRGAYHQNAPTGKVIGYKTGSKSPQNEKTRSNSGFDRAEDIHFQLEGKIKEGPLKNLSLGHFLVSNIHGTFEDKSSFNGYGYKFATTSTYLKYKKELNAQMELSSYLRFNESIEEGLRYEYLLNFSGVELMSELFWSFHSASNLIIGASFDTRRLVNYTEGTVQGDGSSGTNGLIEEGSGELKTSSVYLQYTNQFDIGKGLLTVAGLRFDKAESDYAEGSKISPRFSLVQRISEKWNLKYQYSTALRSPDLKSTLINAEVVEQGGVLDSDKLSAETATSHEVGLAYKIDNLNFNLAFFQTNIKDAINRRSLGGKDSYRNDSGETKSEGFEIDLKYLISKHHYYFFNFTQSKSKAPDDGANSTLDEKALEGIPDSMANLGMFFKRNKHHSSFVIKYIDSLRGESDSDRHDGFMIGDINYSYDYSVDLSLGLKIINLMDEDIRVPNFQERYMPRTVLASASFKF